MIIQAAYLETIDRKTENESILRALRKNLLLQRERLAMYLRILEQEEFRIERGEIEQLTLYVEMEREVVRGIQSVQKVITPLRALYHEAFEAEEPEIVELEASLERLKADILKRNRKNQELLRARMKGIKAELDLLKTAGRAWRRFDPVPEPILVDIAT
jgi:hypothetical protein